MEPQIAEYLAGIASYALQVNILHLLIVQSLLYGKRHLQALFGFLAEYLATRHCTSNICSCCIPFQVRPALPNLR
jgi:hypothetical protein